jgi:hypothetical protein
VQWRLRARSALWSLICSLLTSIRSNAAAGIWKEKEHGWHEEASEEEGGGDRAADERAGDGEHRHDRRGGGVGINADGGGGRPRAGGGEGPKAEERELRKRVKKSTDGARQLVAKCNLEVRKAESALRHEQRLAEERERRWWAAERHKEPPPAYLQLERVYKSIVKGLKAKLELSEARRVVARAEISLEKAKQVQLEVKHAAELRKLCE